MATEIIKPESRSMDRTRNGMSATKVFRVSNTLRERAVKQIIREPYDSDYPDLRCVSIHEEGIGEIGIVNGRYDFTEYFMTVNYSTADQVDDNPKETMTFATEALETGLGKTWKNAGTKCDTSQTKLYPTIIRNISFKRTSLPLSAILSAVGKVNGGWWQGFAPETLLFIGADVESEYFPQRNEFVYAITYRMVWRPNSWNLVWRTPRQAVDDTGSPAFDTNGDPIFVDGIAGTEGWDRPLPNNYSTADFSNLFSGSSSKTTNNRSDISMFSVLSNTTKTSETTDTPTPDIPWLKTS